ncbi:MAG: hypothetical protein QM767_21295 [Anaeromyxobacter sp.]
MDAKATPPAVFVCRRCGSRDVRRSMPRGLWERSIRELTPLHLHFCRGCGHRGWHTGELALAPQDQRERGLASRQVEARDQASRWRRRRQTLLSLVIALGMGTGAAFYLHGCQQRAALVTPPAAE